MSKKQNELGKLTEKDIIAQYFKSKKYWAFVIPKTINGQPFDIIAIRHNDIWLVDAKHLEEKKASFSFDRIEANQITSMMYAEKYANVDGHLGFIIYWEREPNKLFYLNYDNYIDLSQKGLKSVKIQELEDMEDLLCEQL